MDLRGQSEAFRPASAGSHDHGDMTKETLWFLDEDVREDLADADEDTDGRRHEISEPYHFDNCRVAEGMQTIQENYDKVIAAFDPTQPDPSLVAGVWMAVL
jgi:hypothetical protein